ncbi:uncharacterized protein LOC126681807 [Mercurialis annua]|uniref:uncharacterized protein LOC126681807 n=1 Tax=Mercurialis annua TaxID=3986 RepID=UPI00215F5686|nr:uncharacterized protein LOC126681807 [Mercurialis annua]
MKDSNVPKNSTVADMWRNGNWTLPNPIDSYTDDAWDYIKDNFHLNSSPDEVKWLVADNNKFYISKAWKELRSESNQVRWYKLVWNKNIVPRFSFLLWLAIKRRMNTKSRLVKWGVVPDDKCVLCQNEKETIDHCLYECCFVRKIWDKLLPICGCNENINTWRRIISWFCIKASGKNAYAVLRRLILSSTVYYVWTARNKKIFEKEDPVVDHIISNVKNVVLAKINMSPEAFVTGWRGFVLGWLGSVLGQEEIALRLL